MKANQSTKQLIAFLGVGTAFLTLFLPYLLWKSLEALINGLLPEKMIVSRLGDLALRDVFGEESFGRGQPLLLQQPRGVAPGVAPTAEAKDRHQANRLGRLLPTKL